MPSSLSLSSLMSVGTFSPGGHPVGLRLHGLEPMVSLPEQSQAGGHQGGRTQQVDS